MFVLNVLGYKLELGTLHIAAGMMGIFTDGWIFNNASITYLVAYDQTTATFKTFTIDPNLIAVVVAVVTIVSFLFIYFERYASDI